MSLVTRLGYYATRIREAGLSRTVQKLASLSAPYVKAPNYVLGIGTGSAPAEAADKLGAFGRHLREGLGAGTREGNNQARRAELALGEDWPVLGFGNAPIPRGKVWHQDCFHHHTWKRRYFAFVDFVAHDIRCDVKVPWELSRLQFVLSLAEGAAFVPALASACTEKFIDIVEDWIASNRVGYGVNWTVGMEVAIRAINLAFATALIAESLPPKTRDRILKSLAEHYRYLANFPELSDVPGNHYLAGLLGQVCLAPLVGVPGDFERHLGVFIAQADQQFEAEGCQIERALVYHRLCTDMVAMAAAVATWQLGVCPGNLRAILNRAVAFSATMASSAGILPVMGDCDSGQILDFGLPARSVSALLFLTSPRSGICPAFVCWLDAIAGKGRELLVSAGSSTDAANLSGFLSCKVGEIAIVMRHGTQGLFGRAPHDHDDAQSLWISHGESDLLVDRGTYSYTLDPDVRSQDIQSPAHNVLQPAGRARYAGRAGSIHLTMRGAPTCSAALAAGSANAARMETTMANASVVPQLSRTVDATAVDSGYTIVVEDKWSANEPVEMRWHFGPGIEPILNADGKSVEFATQTGLKRLEFRGMPVEKIETYTFDFSPVYGQKCPCFGVRVIFAAAQNAMVTSQFYVMQDQSLTIK